MSDEQEKPPEPDGGVGDILPDPKTFVSGAKLLEVAIKGGWVDDKTGKYIVREMRHIVQTTKHPRWRIAAGKVIMAAASIDVRRQASKIAPEPAQVNVNINLSNILAVAHQLDAIEAESSQGISGGEHREGVDTSHPISKANGVSPK